jgi:uncharacterized protein (TIGR02246 family)
MRFIGGFAMLERRSRHSHPSLRSPRLVLAAAFIACVAGACAQPHPAAPPDTHDADEAAIRSADADWAKAAMAKDIEKCMSVYLDNAVLLASGAPAAVGKDAIRKFTEQLVNTPRLQIKINVAGVDIARSGDMAMDRGTADSTFTDKKGKPVTSTSVYVLVWKKQTDGSWKIAADTSAGVK